MFSGGPNFGDEFLIGEWCGDIEWCRTLARNENYSLKYNSKNPPIWSWSSPWSACDGWRGSSVGVCGATTLIGGAPFAPFVQPLQQGLDNDEVKISKMAYRVFAFPATFTYTTEIRKIQIKQNWFFNHLSCLLFRSRTRIKHNLHFPS